MDFINARKKMSSLQKDSRHDSKPNCCLLCGKEKSSFCNSHSVPQLVLRNITIAGEVMNAGYALEDSLVSPKDGINKSGTFYCICRDCDNSYFSDYEDEKALLKEPTNIVMAEMALKDSIQQLAKRYYEVSLYNNFQKEFHALQNKEVLDDIHKLDIRDYSFEMRRAKKIIDKQLKSGYVVIYSTLLPYRVPFAAQTGITLDKDLDGGAVNDLINMDDDTIVQSLHCGVFPLSHSTRIIICRHKDDRRYIRFENQFRKLPDDKKLELINYYVFKYAENYFFSPSIKDVVYNNKRLKELSREVYGAPNYGHITDPLSSLQYEPVRMDEIPNLLNKEYQLTR